MHFLLSIYFASNHITNFANRKGLDTCDDLLCMSHLLQSALKSGQEARIKQIDFSSVFDRVNYQPILYNLYSVGIECCL